MNVVADYRSFLLSELAKRKTRNAMYSVRAFARDLGVSTTALSDVLGGKRHFSRKNILKTASCLSLSPSQKERMLREASGAAAADLSQDGMDGADDSSSVLQLQEDQFHLIADWYYSAILNLARIASNRADPRWVARRIGISEIEARDAIERLKRMGHLVVAKGRLQRISLPIRTTLDIPSSALRHHHRQNLARAETALERVAVELREISSVTMAIDSRKLAEAKQMIVQFRRKLMSFLEDGEPDQVYTCAMQLFPVMGAESGSKMGNEKREK